MKPRHALLACTFATLCLLSGSGWAQVVTEFSAGISPGAIPGTITLGPDGNLWFTEGSVHRSGRITPAGIREKREEPADRTRVSREQE